MHPHPPRTDRRGHLRPASILPHRAPRRAMLAVGATAALLAPSAGPQAQQASGAPEVVYHNGKVVTVDEDFTLAEAVAIRDGRIVAVGTNAEVTAMASAATRLVDLRGRTMLPGLYDNHMKVNPEEPSLCIDTPDGLEAALVAEARRLPEGQWIVGRLMRPYWHMRMPTRQELDRIVPDRPVALDAGHAMSVNSVALDLAGIGRSSPDPEGGWFVRDERGEPTGILFESPAKRVVTRLFPRPATPPERVMPHLNTVDVREERTLDNMRRWLETFPPMGVTSVNFAGARPEVLRLLQIVYERWGERLPRMTAQLRLRPSYDAYDDLEVGIREAIAEIEGLAFRTGMGDDRFKLGAVKMSIDGGWAAPALWTLEPYRKPYASDADGEPDYHGAVRIPEEALYRVGKRAHELGWQLGIHAIGDAAVVMAVNVIDRILEESPRADARHYLHHVGILPPVETLDIMARRGIIVAQQPNFTYFNTPFILAAVSGDRLATNNPSASLVRHGIRLSYGTDGHPYGPLLSIWSAVTRKGYDGRVYGAEEGVSVADAIRHYTMGSAYLTFDEGERGSIEVGKLADLVVLSDDLLSGDPDRIRDVAVELTVIGGREVFSGRHVQPYYQDPPDPAIHEIGLTAHCG